MEAKFENLCPIVCALILSGCATDHLKVSGQNWRKEGATNASMLMAGIRTGAGFLGGENSFDPKFRPIIAKEIAATQVTSFHDEETTSQAIKAGAEKATVKGELETARQANSRGTYTVLRVQESFLLVDELNSADNKNFRERLSNYGTEARIVVGVALVTDHSENATVKAGLTLNVGLKSDTTTGATIVGEKSGSRTISDGTVFAFEYVRVCWAEATEPLIGSLEVDYPRLESNCPSGTNEDARKALKKPSGI